MGCVAAQAGEDAIFIRQDAILQRLAWSFDGRLVATVGVTHDGSTFNSTVKLWHARTGELVRAFDEVRDCQMEIAFSRDYLAVAVDANLAKVSGGPRELRLFDAASGELRHTIDKSLVPGLTHWSALAFSSDGRRLATAGRGRSSNDELAPFMKVWNFQKDRLIASAAEYLTSDLAEPLADRPIVMSSIAFSPDGTLVAAGCSDSKIRLFSGLTGKLSTTLDIDGAVPGRLFSVADIAFSPDGKTLASPGVSNTVVFWDVVKGKPRRSLQGHENSIATIAFAPDGRSMATGSRPAQADASSQVFLWDTTSGERRRAFSNVAHPVSVLAFSPDGKTLAICQGAGDVIGEKRIRTVGEVVLQPLD